MSATAQAAIYDFDYQVSGDSSIALVNAAGGQVFVEVTENLATAANDVSFRFTNTIPYAESTIVNIFFDSGNYSGLFSGMSISEQSAGVLLTLPGDRSNMNIGNSFDTNFTEDYTVGRGNGFPANKSTNGINPGEHLVLTGTLGAGMSFTDVVNAMNVGIDDNQTVARTGLRISQIVHRIWGVAADRDHGAFVTANVMPVPEADTWALLLAGLGMIGFIARRRRG
jgi:MYXO-CTERM domain-containing protein